MYKAVIVEDENLATARLKSLLSQSSFQISVVATCDSVETSVALFKTGILPDLVFMDIQLADGLSFSIFEHVQIQCPVIFTTAYEEYAIKAFKVNSVDYLLKPIDSEELNAAIAKFDKMHSSSQTISPLVLQSVQAMLASDNYKKRFTIKVGLHIRSIPVEEIAFFYSLEKSTYLCTVAGKHYCLDYTLDAAQKMVNPKHYFRVNRSYLVSHDSIIDTLAFSNSRLKLTLLHCTETEIIVSREKVHAFKQWLDE